MDSNVIIPSDVFESGHSQSKHPHSVLKQIINVKLMSLLDLYCAYMIWHITDGCFFCLYNSKYWLRWAWLIITCYQDVTERYSLSSEATRLFIYPSSLTSRLPLSCHSLSPFLSIYLTEGSTSLTTSSWHVVIWPPGVEDVKSKLWD